MKAWGKFPYDLDTLWLISEIEMLLELENKDCKKMSCIELNEYIETLNIRILKTKNS